MLQSIFSVVSLILAAQLSLAQTAADSSVPAEPLPSDLKFAAIVQFAGGSNENIALKKTLEFRDMISFGESLQTGSDSKLKIITHKRCVVALYDNTTLVAPSNKSSPWRLLEGTARWICPEDKTENVEIKGVTVSIQNGEILFDQKHLFVFRDTVTSADRLLTKNIAYAISKKRFLPLKNQPTAEELWKRDQSFELPKESTRWTAEKPENPLKTRIFLQPHMGFGGIHDWDNDRDITEQKYEVFGARIGTQFILNKSRAVIAFIEHSELENRDALENYSGPVPVGYNSIRIKNSIAAVGLRHSLLDAGSLYYYGGLARQEIEAFIKEDFFSDYKIELVYQWNLVLGVGYQYILFPTSWFSIIAGIEGRIIQSLDQGRVRQFNGMLPANPVDPQGHLLTYSMSLYLGPSINF